MMTAKPGRERAAKKSNGKGHPLQKLSAFRPQRQNVNLGKPHGLAALDKSIRRDGYSAPMVAAADGEVFAGSKRLEHVADIMPDAAPIVVHSDGTRPIIHVRDDIPNADDPRAKRLGVADNVIATMDWNPDGELLAALAGEDAVVAELARQENASLKALATYANAQEMVDAEPQIDRAEELNRKWKVKRGDLWRIGEHRLLCGDCTVRENVERVMDISLILIVTDPPYGVDYDPAWRNDAAEKSLIALAARREGRVENDDRADWTEAWRLFSGDIIYCWHADRRASEVQASLELAGFEIRNQIIWAKQNFAISRGNYHWKHEPCWYAVRKGGNAHWIGDRSNTTLWEVGWDKNAEGGHGTQKPIELMIRSIRNHDGDTYDPFVGSGTTLVACQNLSRRCRAIEISPSYCAVTLERMATAFPGIEIERVKA